MTLSLAIVGWAIVGWCGTPWPRHWPWPPPPPPDPLAGPRPNPWISKILGVLGGIVGGWAFNALFNVDVASPAGLLVTFVGALSGSVIANDFFGLMQRGQARA